MLLALPLALLAGAAVAQDWGKMATISSTMGVSASRLCLGEGSRGDIGCPAYAPSVTTAGDLAVSGTVTAAQFIGDGSGLTNIAGASADRIVSGTTSMLAISSTGYVSLTQSGVNTGWFDPARGLVTIGISSTGAISGTKGFFNSSVQIQGGLDLGGISSAPRSITRVRSLSNDESTGISMSTSGVGAGPIAFLPGGTEAMRIVSSGYVGFGTSTPNTRLEVVGSLLAGEFARGMIWNGSNWVYTYANSPASVMRSFGTGSTQFYVAPGGTQGAVAPVKSAMVFDGNTGNVAVGSSALYPSATLHVGGTLLTTSWTGINFNPLVNTTPTAPLEVSGTVSATRFVGDGSGLTGIGAAGSSDRITSGTTSMLAISSTGYVSLTQSGVNTGWFDPSRGLVTIGVSSTGRISGTNGYFSGRVGIGIAAPLSTLHVYASDSTAYSPLSPPQTAYIQNGATAAGVATGIMFRADGNGAQVGRGTSRLCRRAVGPGTSRSPRETPVPMANVCVLPPRAPSASAPQRQAPPCMFPVLRRKCT
ncbi:hypothetical protein ACFKHW_04245 [Bradyrhizobium lupini]|uniref:hypothetical protein n=1 Tax=Rhizobium lupini TaxID=136996 RepID=UPI003672DF2F